MSWIVFGIVLPWLMVGFGCWLGYQLVRQNGRILLRLEALEQRLRHLNTAPPPTPSPASGLPVGSVAPEFELPDLSGTRQPLSQFRGRRLLLVFSDPQCGPCDQLSPRLERFSRRTPEVQVVMVSRGRPQRIGQRWRSTGSRFRSCCSGSGRSPAFTGCSPRRSAT